MDHLALAVSDQDRSRQFYETYLGFEAEPEPRSDGVLLLHNAQGDGTLRTGMNTSICRAHERAWHTTITDKTG